MRIALSIVLATLLASCAGAGLYNMSDDWCAAHLNASAARCPQIDERRVAAKDAVHVADPEVAINH
jgi:hypothetical protein